jgi:hypothetical protein
LCERIYLDVMFDSTREIMIMTKTLFAAIHSFFSDPVRFKIALLVLFVLLALVIAIAPSAVALAGNAPGGGGFWAVTPVG